MKSKLITKLEEEFRKRGRQLFPRDLIEVRREALGDAIEEIDAIAHSTGRDESVAIRVLTQMKAET
jgi:hypothetical protein